MFFKVSCMARTAVDSILIWDKFYLLTFVLYLLHRLGCLFPSCLNLTGFFDMQLVNL